MKKNQKTRLIALALGLTTLTANTSCEKVGKSGTTAKTSDIVETQPVLEPITEEITLNETEITNYKNVEDLCTHLNTYIYINNIKSITDEIQEYMNIELTQEQKERYDTLLEKTLKQAENCKIYYEANDIISFKKAYNRLCNSKEYINIDDLVEIYALAVNKLYQNDIIKNKNYSITNNSLTIDGITINNICKKNDVVDTKDPFTVLNYYSDDECYDDETMNIINTLQIKMAVLKSIRNIRIGIDTNTNEIYTYGNEALKKIIQDKKQQISGECDVFSWEYDITEGTYIVYNKYGIGNICKNDSYITNTLDEIYKLEQFKRYSETSENIEEIKEIINNWDKEKQKTK